MGISSYSTPSLDNRYNKALLKIKEAGNAEIVFEGGKYTVKIAGYTAITGEDLLEAIELANPE